MRCATYPRYPEHRESNRSTPADVTKASRGEEFRAVPFRSRARAGNGSPVDEFVAVLGYGKEEL